MKKIKISEKKLLDLCTKIFEKSGISAEDAQIAAKVLVTTEMRGTTSHGIVALKRYIDCIRNGYIRRDAKLNIIGEGPGWIHIDGGCGLGMVTAYKAVKMAMDKAKKCGIGLSTVKGGKHFGAAGYYSMMCALEGQIGITMANVDRNMAVTGAAARVIGTNPFSYAIPAGKENAVFLDIAMSKVAGGKVVIANDMNKPIPKGWLINAEGKQTVDPGDYFRGGALLPFSDHKGYGLAVMVECLAALLSGASMLGSANPWGTFPGSEYNDVGFFMLAIDIGQIVPVEIFERRVDDLVNDIRNSQKAEGVERIFLPGEKELEEEKNARRDGIVLNEVEVTVIESIMKEFDREFNINNL